jgi:hypothetical protein
LPNWKLADAPQGSLSVVINTDSLPEMPKETMAEYLHRISKISKYFYSVNQDCGQANQNRLSQINPDDFGLRCINYNIDWIRSGYFERVYTSNVSKHPIMQQTQRLH